MAQHDYNIANASFPTVRTDINNVLSAINSSNSGSSRPSSAVAGTIWLDTSGAATAQLLKLYDGADDILLGTVNFTANTIDWSDSSVDGVSFKQEGTNFTNSLLIGHATTGTLSSAGQNTGVGLSTLAGITSGDYNTAAGYQAGVSNTSATGNTFIGALSGANTTSAGTNTGVGYRTLWANAASGNTATGYYSGRFNSSGAGNVSMGREALQGVSGNNNSFNTALGAYSNTAVTTGGYNVTLGYQSGDNITSGDGNVIIGSVDAASATGDRQLKIAGYDGSTTTTWISGSSAGVVTLNAANVTQQALTSSSNAVAWDASAKPNAVHITTENTTFSAPSNAIEGAFICVEINYNGSHSIAWNTVFEFAASTAPTFTSADGKTDIMVFRYSGAVWQEVGRTLNLSEA